MVDAIVGRVWKRDHELLTAVAGDQIGGSEVALQPTRDPAQDIVTRRVAVLVI